MKEMMKKQKNCTLISCLLMFGIILFVFSSIGVQASEKSDGKNMAKVVKYFGKKQYSKAEKYNRKVSVNVSEKCVSKMSSKMKKAYRNLLKKYTLGRGYSVQKTVWYFYLTDVDNDNKAELLMVMGSCEADARLYVYKYKKGKAVKIGSVSFMHSEIYAYPGHNGVIQMDRFTTDTIDDTMYVIQMKKNKLVRKKIGIRRYSGDGLPFSLNCNLTCYTNSTILY